MVIATQCAVAIVITTNNDVAKDAIATTIYVAISSFATKFVHGNNLFCHGVVTW
jgi:hypothetical protein